jgi:predicted nucleic acid-binding protein
VIFVDAGAFIARCRTTDHYHAVAQLAWSRLERSNRRCFTNNLVIAEAAKAVGKMAGNGMAADFIRTILASDVIILRGTSEEEEDAAEMLVKFADQRVGFTDCVSFAQMRRNRIRHVFGFDRHFELAGFTLWPGSHG